MRKQLMLAAAAAIFATAAYASGNHAGGHDEAMAVGEPGEAADVTRTIDIAMVEKEDGSMAFEPASIAVKQGETVRLKFTNKGQLDHEFVMGTQEDVMEHKALMEKFPNMEHADPNAIRLAPGAKGEIVWTFANAGEFAFACLIPGHHDLGMKGAITVGAK